MKKLVAGILFVCTTISLVTTVHSQGTFIFNSANGHYYEAVSGNISWPDARDAAVASTYLGYQGHLVTISSSAENAFVYSLYASVFPEYNNAAQSSWVWLGGYQPTNSVEPAGGWTWVTDEPFDFARWDSGQPSDSGGSPYVGSQDFLLMWYGGYWNDAAGPGYGGIAVAGYMVEFEPVPEPSTFALGSLAFGLMLLFHSWKRRTDSGE
jgi:PEP-CTERM motif./Lectin C-type domain.